MSDGYQSARATTIKRNLGLSTPPILAAVCDVTVTLRGQPDAYWAGDFHLAADYHPISHSYLSIHPVAFVVACILWAGIVVALIALLPDTLATIGSIIVTMGHTFGATTWLWYSEPYGYHLGIGFIAISGIALGLGIRTAFPPPRSSQRIQKSNSQVLRWVVVVALIAIGVWSYLIPPSWYTW